MAKQTKTETKPSMFPSDDKEGKKMATVAPIEVNHAALEGKKPSKMSFVRAALDAVNGWDRTDGVFTEVKDWLTKNVPAHGIEKDDTLSTMISQAKRAKAGGKKTEVSQEEAADMILDALSSFGNFEGLAKALDSYTKVAELVEKIGSVERVREVAAFLQKMQQRFAGK